MWQYVKYFDINVLKIIENDVAVEVYADFALLNYYE